MQNGIDTLRVNQLVDELNHLGIPFLQRGTARLITKPLEPAILVMQLATSDEARLRLALIPLLLRHPAFAADVLGVVAQLPPAAQVVLKCYYMAAQLLQQKYQQRLHALFGDTMSLPDLFMAELGLPAFVDPEHGLQLLAERHRQLSSRTINWLGTYEHGAQRLLLHCECLLKQGIRSNEISHSELIMPQHDL